jgi:tRNA pseudouridine32 synthase/23S rRNA pseudouridine746 synthase
MSALGIPILNDRFYPTAVPAGADDYTAPLKLLASAISFIDPIRGVERSFESKQTL